MIEKAEIDKMAARYTSEGFPLCSITALGSHSMLDIAKGAMDEGFRTIAICKKGREQTYGRHYKFRSRGNDYVGCIGETIVLDDWKEITKQEVLDYLSKKNAIMIPHRSLEVYLKYGIIDSLPIPFFGNRELLRAEERVDPLKVPKNQDYLIELAGIQAPKRFKSPEEIDRTVIVKATAAVGERDFMREFPKVKNPNQYEIACAKQVKRGKTEEERVKIEKNFRSALIEEYMPGEKVNLNFFHSVIHNETELLGCDIRKQFPNGEELLHQAVSLRESLLEKVFDMGERFVDATKKVYPPGAIGSFSLQTVADKDENLRVYDVSLRIPGSPDTEFTPYPGYLFREPISFGRRIAREIKEAILAKRLEEVVS